MRTVRDVLRSKGRQVFTVAPDATVLEALSLMADHDVGALLVVEGDQVVGVLSERDYARKVVLHGATSRNTPVRQIMSDDVVTVTDDDSIDQCMALMTDHRCRHLPVVVRGNLRGVVSIGDMVKAKILDQGVLIEQLQHYIAGEFP